MSIHKSQGQTLPYVKIDLAKVFEKGAIFLLELCDSAVADVVDLKAKVTSPCRGLPR